MPAVRAEALDQAFHQRQVHPADQLTVMRSPLPRPIVWLLALAAPSSTRQSLLAGVPMNWMIRWAGGFPVFADEARAKGGHEEGDALADALIETDNMTSWQGQRIDTTSTHGTGCTLASAIASRLALGDPLPDAVAAGTEPFLVVGSVSEEEVGQIADAVQLMAQKVSSTITEIKSSGKVEPSRKLKAERA